MKNLHPHAHKFDIGIYCESNGHGTFLVHHEKTELLGKLIEQFSSLSINFENEDQKVKLNEFLHEANQLHDFILICN